MKKMNLAFLASHGGSNMQAIIDAVKAGRINANLIAVISNNSSSKALQRAETEGIPGYHISSQTHHNPDTAITRLLLEKEADLIILAGYMKKVGNETLKAFKGRVLNIHPALLPNFGGKGMYGKRVHEAVLSAGVPVTGVTIHVIDERYDNGPILAQAEVAVQDNDTADTLAARVLETEHTLYPDTIAKIISGDIPLPSS